MVGAGVMIKMVIESVKSIEKVLKDWVGQKETKFPKL